MDKPIRVLQIIGIAAAGGVEAVIMNYYTHIDRSRVQFDFVIHNDSKVDPTEKVEALGGRVYKVTPYYKNPIAFMADIYHIIKEGHYEIVHSNMNTLSTFSLCAAWLAGAPVRILHNHSTSSPGETARNVMKYILRPWAKVFANHYWACSRLAAEWMYGKKWLDSGKVTVINNAIDLSRYAFHPGKRAKLRAEYHLGDTFVIGHVGRFVPVKNHDFVVSVFAKLHEQHPDTALVFIGDGPLRTEVEKKCKALGISDCVNFLGIRDDVSAWYNVMDVFLLPSHAEGFPVVGVEAQANGLPIVVSDKVTEELAMTDVISYEPLSLGAAAWAEKVEVIYKQKDRTHRDTTAMMRAAGFDIEEAAKVMEEYYRKLSTGGGTRL